MPLSIRKAQIDDSAHIARVQVDSYRVAYADFFPPEYLAHFTYEEQTQDWRDLLSSNSDDALYIAEDADGEIVGYALGQPGASAIPPYDSELVALHVCRAYQEQGIGRQLVQAIARQLQQQGCTALMLWVLKPNPARAFYERLGGQWLGEQTIELGETITAVEVAYGWPDIGSLLPADRVF